MVETGISARRTDPQAVCWNSRKTLPHETRWTVRMNLQKLSSDFYVYTQTHTSQTHIHIRGKKVNLNLCLSSIILKLIVKSH